MILHGVQLFLFLLVDVGLYEYFLHQSFDYFLKIFYFWLVQVESFHHHFISKQFIQLVLIHSFDFISQLCKGGFLNVDTFTFVLWDLRLRDTRLSYIHRFRQWWLFIEFKMDRFDKNQQRRVLVPPLNCLPNILVS